MKRTRGEITIFLGLILLSVWALLCGLAESARTAAARYYLRHGMNSAMDSLMSQYHRELWEQYRILGLEYGQNGELEREFEGFLKPYLEADNWYPMELVKVEPPAIVSLTDEGGAILERQVTDYMRYGLLSAVWDEVTEGEAQELVKAVKEADAVKEIAERYETHSREALRLEERLEAIYNSLGDQEESWSRGLERLEEADGSGFLRESKELIEELEGIPPLVDRYQKEADSLNSRLEESRDLYGERKKDLSGGAAAALEEEIQRYETYISKDGERRKEVEALTEAAAEAIEYGKTAMDEARQVQEYISRWEPEDEDDELDEEELWEPVKRRWERCPLLKLGVQFGVADQEKAGLQEQAAALFSGKLVHLVLPEGRTASQRRPDLTGAPSLLVNGGEEGKGLSLMDRVMMGEYVLRFFNRYDAVRQEPGCCQYEMEYILFGNVGDSENLEEMAGSLMKLRHGMNLLHILSDGEKREAARNLAAAIVGGTGLLPLVGVTAFLIMGVWALGEALWDVRTLLNEGRVPLLKTRETWKLGLDQLLTPGSVMGWESEASQEESGLDYRGYSRLFLLAGHDVQMDYRIMDMIQSNLRMGQEDFRMILCGDQVNLKAEVCGKHVFFNLGLWKSLVGRDGGTYKMKLAVSGRYH